MAGTFCRRLFCEHVPRIGKHQPPTLPVHKCTCTIQTDQSFGSFTSCLPKEFVKGSNIVHVGSLRGLHPAEQKGCVPRARFLRLPPRKSKVFTKSHQILGPRDCQHLQYVTAPVFKAVRGAISHTTDSLATPLMGHPLFTQGLMSTSWAAHGHACRWPMKCP